MKSRFLWSGLALALAIGCAAVFWWSKPRGLPRLRGDYKSTTVAAALDEPIVEGRNLIYCASFQLAWNELSDRLCDGGEIELVPASPLAERMNAHRAKARDLSGDGFLAVAGHTKDGVIEHFQTSMQDRFPGSGWQRPSNANGFVALAYLERTLAFKEKFDRLQRPIRFLSSRGETQVVAFGIEKREKRTDHQLVLGSQVTILNYESIDNFVIELRTMSEDRLTLAKVPRQKSLEATVASVQETIDAARKKSESPTESRQFRETSGIHHAEPLMIPVVSLGVSHSFQELEGRNIRNLGEIAVARQNVRFLLDESGVKLSSDAELSQKSAESGVGTRQFIFDKPFLLMLDQPRNNAVYLAIWVETPEVLAPQ